MRIYKSAKQAPACCIYCKKEFILKSRQKWHGCRESMLVKKKIERASTIAWRKKEYAKRPPEISKASWKLCKKCKSALTPNYFGVCSNCLDILSSQMDIDMIVEFEAGHEKRNGVWVR